MTFDSLEVDVTALERLPETEPLEDSQVGLRRCHHTCFITCLVTLAEQE
jgi:hypothetical protein